MVFRFCAIALPFWLYTRCRRERAKARKQQECTSLAVPGQNFVIAGKGLVVAVERVYSSCCWNLSVCLFVMIAGKGSVVAGTSYLLLERV